MTIDLKWILSMFVTILGLLLGAIGAFYSVKIDVAVLKHQVTETRVLVDNLLENQGAMVKHWGQLPAYRDQQARRRGRE